MAELDGRLAGFAKTTFLSPGEVWLEGLRVDPARRGTECLARGNEVNIEAEVTQGGIGHELIEERFEEELE